MKRTLLATIAVAAIAWGQSFEAASIRPRADEHMISVRYDGGHLVARNDSLYGLVMWTWNLKTYQIVGLPKWGEEEGYDIDAKAPEGTPDTKESGRKMMELLLAQRFHLRLHHETREMPVYDLVVMKGGPKFHESAPDASPELSMGGPQAWNELKVTAGDMAQLAQQVAVFQEVGRPVIDKTGLTGRYDYSAKIAAGIPSGDDPELQSIFAALQNQLGLKLEPSKANIEVLVVDSAEHPTAN